MFHTCHVDAVRELLEPLRMGTHHFESPLLWIFIPHKGGIIWPFVFMTRDYACAQNSKQADCLVGKVPICAATAATAATAAAAPI